MDTHAILLVDNNALTARLFVEVLRQHAIENEVVTVGDGVEALDYLFGEGEYASSNNSVMPRLVVMDISMPRMDGLETLRRIRADERTKYVPVVMFSSSDLPQDMRAAYDGGANGYVSKLSDIPFPDLVPLMVQYWLGANKCPLN